MSKEKTNIIINMKLVIMIIKIMLNNTKLKVLEALNSFIAIMEFRMTNLRPLVVSFNINNNNKILNNNSQITQINLIKAKYLYKKMFLLFNTKIMKMT